MLSIEDTITTVRPICLLRDYWLKQKQKKQLRPKHNTYHIYHFINQLVKMAYGHEPNNMYMEHLQTMNTKHITADGKRTGQICFFSSLSLGDTYIFCNEYLHEGESKKKGKMTHLM